jgi:hypothetical protein
MREYLSHTETHPVQCPPPHQTGAGIGCPEMTLDCQQRHDFPRMSSSTKWCLNHDPFGDAGRHIESVILWETCWECNVENKQNRKSRGLPSPIGPKCKRLSNLFCP